MMPWISESEIIIQAMVISRAGGAAKGLVEALNVTSQWERLAVELEIELFGDLVGREVVSG